MIKQHLILASKSPRRQELLKHLVPDFTIEVREVDEVYPDDMAAEEVPLYLAQLKAGAYNDCLHADTLILTSDTVVVLEGRIYGKPKDREDAIAILRQLSGKIHQVITGVCLLSPSKKVLFSDVTYVHFKPLTEAEIIYYVDKYQPYDKAGAYAIQEWIGMIGISKIDGCYFNVMGLPLSKLYDKLKEEFV
jgi:septum formation protein